MSKNKKLKLLIIQQSPDWGGAEEWMSTLVGSWPKNQVTIYGLTNLKKLASSWKKSGATVNHLPFTLDVIGNLKGLIKTIFLLPFAIIYYISVLSAAKKNGINLILMSGFSEKMLITLLSPLFKLPVVWFEYGPLDTIFKKNLYLPQALYRLSQSIPKKILTISQNTKTNLITKCFVYPKKLSVIYPGVPIASKSKPTTSLTVGCLSRLAPEKGQRLLLKAWPQVIAKLPQARLKIAGTGPDLHHLKTLCDQLKISSSVNFLGFIKNKLAFYKSLSLFVFPSTWLLEGFGLVAAEAMSHSLPAISFNVGPIPEIIDSSTGIVINSKKPKQLAQAIIKLLKNQRQRQLLGRQARQKAQKLFNLKTQANKIKQELIACQYL